MQGAYLLRLAAIWLCSLAVCMGLDPTSEQLAVRYHAILERNPASETSAERLWDIYSASGETTKLLSQLKELAEREPVAGISLASFLQRSGQLEAAETALQNIASDSLDSKALIRMGRLWALLGKPDEAVLVWEKAMAADPQNLALRGQIAQAYLDTGKPLAAIEHWEFLANKSTASERLLALENLSAAYEVAGDPSQAAHYAKQALNSLAPGHWKLPDLIEQTINLHDKAGELEALEAEWTNSKPPGLAARMAVISKKRGDTKAEAKWLHEAVEADPQNAILLRDLAFAEIANGDMNAAESALSKRHSLDPNDEEMLGDLASFLANQGKEAEALFLIETHFANSSLEDRGLARKIALLRKLNFREGIGQTLRKRFEQSKDSWSAAKELAEHLLEDGSSAEAIQVVETLDLSTPAENREEIRRDASKFFFEMQVPAESERWARKALDIAPENQETILLLAEILEAKGDIVSALALVQQAAPASADAVDMELDQRLFSLLQRRDSESDPALRNIGTKEFLEMLLEKGEAEQSADRLIRASRWAAWTGDSASAVTSLRSALTRRADSPELLDRLANELEKLAEFHEASLVLWRLEALQPDPATKIRIARMEVARGEAEAAVTLLALAAKENPNDANLARELAMALEAAGQNFEALESWLRAYELSPPSEKQNLSKSVLKSFSRLSLIDRGLEFLTVTAPRLPDDRLRLEFLRDGTAFARENNVLDRWQTFLESQASQPSVAWKLALADVQPEMLDSDPVVVAESSEALELLLQDAEAKRDFGRAAMLAGKLAALPNAAAQDQIRHLNFLEMTQNSDKTEQVWNSVLRRFPRSSEVQLAAAEFFRRQGNEAREVESLRAASRLGPLPAQVLLRMARSPVNDKATAFEDYEMLLQRIPSDPTSSRNPPPLPERLAKLPGFLSLTETDPQACRLMALREVGQLLENSPTKMERLEMLTPAPMEKVWAYWGAGEMVRALDLLLTISDPDDQKIFDKALVALSLESMAFQRLQGWAEAGETLEERWMLITEIMAAMISAGWQPTMDQLRSLLAESPAFVRLRTAETLAAFGSLRAAIALGIPIGLPPSLEAEARFRLAGWKFALRDPQGAAAELTRCLEINAPSGSFENLNFSALRALWLLEGSGNRGVFEQKALTRVKQQGSQRAIHATESLFFALRGDQENFRRAIASWLEQPTDGATSSGLLALKAATTFENWNLLARARDICRTALNQNPTFFNLNGEISIERALENAIIISLLMESQTATSKYLVNEWVARGAKREELAAAGARAAGTGRIATARILHEKVFEMQPMNPTSWLQLLALRSFPGGKSEQPAAWFVSASEDQQIQIPSQSLLQLAYALTGEGEIRQALAILEAVPKAKATPPIQQAKDNLMIELGLKEPEESPPPAKADEEPPTDVAESSGKIAAAEKAITEQWNRDWASGSLASGEALARLAIERNDQPRLQGLVKGMIENLNAKPTDLAAFAKIMMEGKKYAEAVQVFARLDEFGISDHSQALSYAEALWKTGRRADALDIAKAFDQTARVDPALRLSLAAFYLSVDRPDAAIHQMDQPGQSLILAQKSAPLRAAAGALLLARDRTEDARIQIEIAAQVPRAAPPDLVANYFEHLEVISNAKSNAPKEGQSGANVSEGSSGDEAFHHSLFGLSPTANEFALAEVDLRAFRWVVAQRALKAGFPDVALNWLSIDPVLAMSPEAIELASKATDASSEALKTYWSLVSESPMREARQVAETFFAQAEATQKKPQP